jgi:hypothetical protein
MVRSSLVAVVVGWGTLVGGCSGEAQGQLEEGSGVIATPAAAESTETHAVGGKGSVAVRAAEAKLYLEPAHAVVPMCDIYTHLSIEGRVARLRDAVDGTCKIFVHPNPRAFRLHAADIGCGSLQYTGAYRTRDGVYSIVITDHRERVCRDLVPAQLIVEETTPGFPWPITVTRYSLDGQEEEVKGTLELAAGIGGEHTGYSVQTEAGPRELILTAAQQQYFTEGRVARVRGFASVLPGVEIESRSAVRVTDLLVCPAPGTWINLMPGPGRPAGFGETTRWILENCPDVHAAH